MSAAESNRKLRYYRIQQLYKYLQDYQMSTEFITSNLCEFFTVGEQVIYLALKHEPINWRYNNLDLDFKWADLLVKKVQSKQYRQRKKERAQIQSQPKLFND